MHEVDSLAAAVHYPKSEVLVVTGIVKEERRRTDVPLLLKYFGLGDESCKEEVRREVARTRCCKEELR